MVDDSGNGTGYFFSDLHQAHTLRKTGVLTATNNDETVAIFIKNGVLIHATGFQKKILLGYLLQNKGLVSEKQLADCLEESIAKNQSLGKTLVLNGYITIDTLSAMIRKQAVLSVAALLIWPNVSFEFKEVSSSEDAIIPVRISIIATICEAVRRVDKISIIKRYLPDPASVFGRASAFNPDEISLTAGEAAVLEQVNGDRNITRIVEHAGMGEDDVYRCLMILFSIGMIERVNI